MRSPLLPRQRKLPLNTGACVCRPGNVNVNVNVNAVGVCLYVAEAFNLFEEPTTPPQNDFEITTKGATREQPQCHTYCTYKTYWQGTTSIPVILRSSAVEMIILRKRRARSSGKYPKAHISTTPNCSLVKHEWHSNDSSLVVRLRSPVGQQRPRQQSATAFVLSH